MPFFLPKHLSLVFPIVCVIFLTAGMTACSNQAKQDDSAEKGLSFGVRNGKRLFLHYCSPCHGEDAQGSGRYFPSQIKSRPTDFVNSSYLHDTDDVVIFSAIKLGSASLEKSIYSPAYKNTLRDEEVDDIIDYLRSIKKKTAKESSGQD